MRSPVYYFSICIRSKLILHKRRICVSPAGEASRPPFVVACRHTGPCSSTPIAAGQGLLRSCRRRGPRPQLPCSSAPTAGGQVPRSSAPSLLVAPLSAPPGSRSLQLAPYRGCSQRQRSGSERGQATARPAAALRGLYFSREVRREKRFGRESERR